MAMETSKQPQD